MRCPECGKFAKYAEPGVEALDFGVEDERCTAEVQVTLICAEDDTELKQGTLEASGDFQHTCDLEKVVAFLLKSTSVDTLGADDVDKAVADRDFEAIDCEVEPLENTGSKKSLYGATVKWTVSCSACDETIVVQDQVTGEASDFEEVV